MIGGLARNRCTFDVLVGGENIAFGGHAMPKGPSQGVLLDYVYGAVLLAGARITHPFHVPLVSRRETLVGALVFAVCSKGGMAVLRCIVSYVACISSNRFGPKLSRGGVCARSARAPFLRC